MTAVQVIANPAVTLARILTDTFAGIAPRSAPAFVAAELIGATLAVLTITVLYPRVREAAADVVLPHASDTATGQRSERNPTTAAGSRP